MASGTVVELVRRSPVDRSHVLHRKHVGIARKQSRAVTLSLNRWRLTMNRVMSCLLAAGIAGVSPVSLPIASKALAQGNCVTLLNNYTFANGCNRAVWVRWTDQGACIEGGCGSRIGPEAYLTITPITGAACWTVAWYPGNPPLPRC